MDPDSLFWDREAPLSMRGDSLWERANALWNDQGKERKSVLEDALIVYFGNARHQVGGYQVGGLGLIDLVGDPDMSPPGQNVVQMCVDQLVSHTIHNKVRPFFLTEKGEVEDREKAQGMQRAVEGTFHTEGIYGRRATKTAKIGYIGDGAYTEVIADYARNKVTYKDRLPHEYLVEPGERVAYTFDTIDRGMLLEDYGYDEDERGKRRKNDLYEQIKGAMSAPKEWIDERTSQGVCSDRLLVITGYHLPSGFVDLDDEKSFGIDDEGLVDPDMDPGHDGVRMVMIEGVVLHSEPYPYDELPCAEFHPSENPTDFGSRGIPEQLAGGQLTVNRYNKRIDGIMNAHAVPRLIAWRNAKINPNKISNDWAQILFSNVPPAQAAQYLQPPGAPPELLNRVDRIIDWMKGQAGVNDMTLSGEKPPGLDHAPGMEHLLDETTLRHTEKFSAWGRYHCKLARKTVDAFRLLALRDPSFEVVTLQKDKYLERINWRKVELRRSQFVTHVWESSLLPQTPGMKMRRLTELAAMGAVTPQQIQGALVEQYPDMASMVGDSMKMENNIIAKIRDCARNGLNERNRPMSYMDLEMGKALSRGYINQLDEDGDERGMDNVIKWWEAAQEMVTSARPAPPSNPGAAAMMPPSAVPLAPPGMPGAPPPGAPIQ